MISRNNSVGQLRNSQYTSFYDKLIKNNYATPEIWKCILRKNLVANFILNDSIIRKILHFLYEEKDKELNFAFLEQLIQCKID